MSPSPSCGIAFTTTLYPQNKLVAAKYSWKLLREVEHFSLTKSVWLFSGYAYEAIKVRLLSS